MSIFRTCFVILVGLISVEDGQLGPRPIVASIRHQDHSCSFWIDLDRFTFLMLLLTSSVFSVLTSVAIESVVGLSCGLTFDTYT